jgi:hypothetical protein
MPQNAGQVYCYWIYERPRRVALFCGGGSHYLACFSLAPELASVSAASVGCILSKNIIQVCPSLLRQCCECIAASHFMSSHSKPIVWRGSWRTLECIIRSNRPVIIAQGELRLHCSTPHSPYTQRSIYIQVETHPYITASIRDINLHQVRLSPARVCIQGGGYAQVTYGEAKMTRTEE